MNSLLLRSAVFRLGLALGLVASVWLVFLWAVR